MRINRLLRKKRLHDNLFFPLHPLSMNDDISKHAAFLYRGIFKRPYRNHSKDREFHGIAHASNVAIYISLLITLYSKYSECDLTNEDKKLLQLAALFHDAGREGDGKDLWDKDSAELLYHYLTTTLKVSHEKAVVFSEAIANKDYEPGNIYYHLVIEEGEISWKDEIAQK